MSAEEFVARLHEPDRGARARLSGVRRAAARVLADPGRTARLLQRAADKARRARARLDAVREELGTLIRLLGAWSRGRYRQIPWRALSLAAAAVVYFVNPMDLIPDWLHGVGLLDDVTVITMVAGALREELERFREWERGTG